MYILLKQQYLCWLGHVMRMADGRIPKDLLYGELVQGKCPRGRPQLRYKDICKRDLKALGMDINSWETLTSDCSAWRLKMQHSLLQFEEETLVWQAEAKRQSRNQRNLVSGQNVSVLSVEGIATLKLAFLATLDAVLGPLLRARYRSLLRRKDANNNCVGSSTKLSVSGYSAADLAFHCMSKLLNSC
uniref:Uncharacterized protein n=1 Tax=Micrurus lemniscatus lemniscatus TaxID=129467 RepID=A0A2D4JA50_MICLE